MVKESKFETKSGVDKELVAMFLRMSPEERLRANDNALRAILELRHAYRQQKTNFTTRFGPLDVLAAIEEGRAYGDLLEHSVEIKFRGHTIRVLDLKMLIQLKRTSTDPKDRRCLPVLEATLRQLEQEYGSDQDIYKKNDEN
jgi:hypothetical protein